MVILQPLHYQKAKNVLSANYNTTDVLTATYHSLCLMLSQRKITYAAASPLMSLGFAVITKPASESSKSSDAGDDPDHTCDGDVGMSGFSFCCHHEGGPATRSTVSWLTSAAL